MERYKEKVIRRYVIATLDNPTLYLKKTLQKAEYSFVEDITMATKTHSRKTADTILNYFYSDTNLRDIELVIIPVEITYEILDESEQI